MLAVAESTKPNGLSFPRWSNCVTQTIERYPALGPQVLDGEGKLARHAHVTVKPSYLLLASPGMGSRLLSHPITQSPAAP
jgi:hypothetical protein